MSQSAVRDSNFAWTWVVNVPSGGMGPGHQACLGYGGGHTTWTCRTCDETVYGPPLGTHCRTLDGPAVVRISNAAL
jgi:hypothetical protein